MNGTLSGFTALFIWSSSAALVAYVGRLPPLEVAGFTWLVASLSLAGFFAARGQSFTKHFHRPLSDYIFVTFGIGVYTALYYMSFKYAPVFEANALNYLWPILLMVFISLFQKHAITIFTVIGMMLGFIGSIMLFLIREDASSFGSFTTGHILAVAAALIWAFYSCFSRDKHYPVGFLIPIFMISGVCTFICHAIFEDWVMPNAAEWIVIITLGVARLGYAFWDHAMRSGNQLLVTSASYFTPLLSTIVLAVAGFGTTNPLIALAAVFIIAGCLVVNADKLQKAYRKLRSGWSAP